MPRSDLPFGSEFSPSQIDLAEVLELAHLHKGDGKAFKEAVRARYFETHETSTCNQRKLANNTKLGMHAYKIIDRNVNLTDFGKELYDLRKKKVPLYAALAKHILLHLNGMALVQCIRDMTAADERVDLTTLRSALGARDIHYPRGGKHPSIMRLWLAEAGVFPGNRWRLDERRLEEVLGAAPDLYAAFSSLTSQRLAFLRALINTGTTEPQPANQVARLAEVTYGVNFPEKSLPKSVLHELEHLGYITTKKTTTGRGAKPFLVAPTKYLVAEVAAPLLEQLAEQSDPKLLPLLKKPMSDILRELDSKDRHIAGLALEALGFKLMRLLDMEYVATRLRGHMTGGAEVDLVFHSARLIYSRWQVQCKNTARVALEDVAKEVGLTHLLKSNAIVMVTTGKIGEEARRYANRIMADLNLAIVMMDQEDLAAVAREPTSIRGIFQREARHAMRLKELNSGDLR